MLINLIYLIQMVPAISTFTTLRRGSNTDWQDGHTTISKAEKTTNNPKMRNPISQRFILGHQSQQNKTKQNNDKCCPHVESRINNKMKQTFLRDTENGLLHCRHCVASLSSAHWASFNAVCASFKSSTFNFDLDNWHSRYTYIQLATGCQMLFSLLRLYADMW